MAKMKMMQRKGMASTRTNHAAGYQPRRGPVQIGLMLGIGMTIAFGGSSNAFADEVAPNGKGIVGGALLGAEAVAMTESLIGVRQGWAHAVGAGLGAVGGGLAGYAVEQSVSDGKAPAYMLAGGISLIIPALVFSLNATRYRPFEGSSEDNAPIGPAPEPGTVGRSLVVGSPAPESAKPASGTAPSEPAAAPPAAPTAPADSKPAAPPQSVIELTPSQLRVGVPALQVRQMYSLQQTRELGLPQHTEYRLPVIHVAF